MSKVAARLRKLGIALPPPPAPMASYVPFVISGNLVFTSGQIPDPKYTGKLGAEISLENGQTAAQLCAINILAQLKAACNGDLDRIRRCVKVTVFVNATPDFTRHPEVANGASDLFVAVLGEAGRHARVAVGSSSLPRNVAVEVEAVFEIA
jgi:enamine deaminase RidA (YjgF/YER057c/UK114 family)